MSSTPVILALTPSRGQTTWIGASTASGNGVTFSTISLGSPPTRYSDGSRGSVLSELGCNSRLYWPFWATTSPGSRPNFATTSALLTVAGMWAVTFVADAFHTTVTRSLPRSNVTRLTAAGQTH